MAVFKTLAFMFLLCFKVSEIAATDENSSFSFNGFAKSSTVHHNIGLFGDSKLVNGESSIQLTNSVSWSEGRVIYKKPIKLFQGNERKIGSFSSNFSFSMSNEIGGSLAFVMIPSSFDLKLFGSKDSSLGFLLHHTKNKTAEILAVEFGISKKGNRLRISIGKPESGKLRNSLSFGHNLSKIGGLINCWIDFEASSKRIEVRLSVGSTLKPVNPLISYSIDLFKLWENGEFLVGLASVNGNSSKPCFLHSWSFKVRYPLMSMHSEPLDPNEVSKSVKEEEKVVKVTGRGKCMWRMFGVLVLGGICGTLGAMLALYLWTVWGNRRSVAVVPEEFGDKSCGIDVMKGDVEEKK